MQAGIAHRFHRAIQPHMRHLIAPRRHRADASMRTGIDNAEEVGLVAQCRSVDGQPLVVFGQVAHYSSLLCTQSPRGVHLSHRERSTERSEGG
jgi:hypothetical protein